MPRILPQVVTNIRYVFQKHQGTLGLGLNRSRWAGAVYANTPGNRPRNLTPMRSLLMAPELDNFPSDQTVDRALLFITTRIPTIQRGWCKQEGGTDFEKKIDDAVTEYNKRQEAAATTEVSTRPTVRGGANGLEAIAHSPVLDENFGEQKHSCSFVGEYLLFRWIVSRKEWSVAHMVIRPPRRDNGPCWFVTRSPPADGDMENPIVCGLFYEPPSRPRQYFAIGRHVDVDGEGRYQSTVELRATYLMAVPRINNGKVGQTPRDLRGIRLGPGRHYGEPRAYAIWCARLEKTLSIEERTKCIAQFSARNAKRLNSYVELVPGLNGILDWVKAQQHLAIWPTRNGKPKP